MRMILLGAPGSGKGTQAEILSQRFSIPIISTGNILKEAVAAGTELGVAAAGYIDQGQLVPDELIIGVLKKRIEQEDCADGFILDGVPRTRAQAEALNQMGVAIDRVISIHVTDDAIIERITGRRSCPGCGASYHIEYRVPIKPGVCDNCGTELVTRSDDTEEMIRTRLQVYHESTEQLKEYYSQTGILYTVQGEREISDTTRNLFRVLEL